jgi:hypothetical protein
VRHVRGWALIAAAALSVAVVCGAVARAAGPEVQVAGDKHGLAYARGQAGSHAPSQKALLLYHSGNVMTSSAAVKAIFWGPSWSNSTFVGDKISGLDTFYTTIKGSAYLGTNTEYTDFTGGSVSTSTSYAGHVTDPTATPSKDPGTSGVLAEVAKEIGSGGAVANGYYPVYTDIPRGNAGYCAWHSWGSVGSTPVQFAFFFKLDGDGGCDPGNDAGHSPGLAALANVSGHELSEALTDPRGAGWFDRQGAENADKCAWTFNGTESFGSNSSWYIQGNFSNAAYQAKSGYDHAGCINGNR